MQCKFCKAELEANSSVCPQCGKDNLKDNLKGLKIVTLVLICLVMLILLAGLVCYGVTGSFIPNWSSLGGSETTAPTDKYDEAFYAAMDEVVATMGEQELTNKELQIYYWVSAYNNTGDADLTKDLSEQIYDADTGKTYHDYFLELALDTWQQTAIMVAAGEAAGFELPSEYTEYLESMESELEYYVYMYAYYYGYDLSTVDDLIALQFGPGADYETYYQYTYDYYYGNLYWIDLAETYDVTDDEINAYFDEHEESLANDYSLPITKDYGNLVDLRNIMINVITTETTDADGNKVTVEDWDATLAAAQAIYDQWLAGDMTEESFMALAEEHSADSNASAGGLYTDMYKTSMLEVDVRHILVQPEGGTTDSSGVTTYTDDEWAAAYAEAEKILGEWLAGDMTEESFGQLANTYSDDNNGSVTNGGIYTDIYAGQMVAAFEEWCFDDSRQVGDYGIVQTTYGYHIMYYVHGDVDADHWTFADERVTGDHIMVKTDDGYQILYYVANEPAWYRYSRYGAQSEKASDHLDELIEASPYTINKTLVVIGDIY